MKILKKTTVCFLCAAMLLQLLIISALAAGITITLSTDSCYAGDSVTISGTCDPDIIITVKALDPDGNIVYINPVLSQSDGTYSTTFIVPDIDAGTLTIIAGTGSDVASAAFTVTVKSGYIGNSNNGGENSQTVRITDCDGNTVSGTLEATGNDIKILIARDKFDDFAAKNGSAAMLDAGTFAMEFSESALDGISGAADKGNISLTVETVDTSTLSDEVRALVGGHPVYEFTLMAGDTRISDLGGWATISIPYKIAAEEDPNAIVVYYIDDDGNPTPVRGRYNAETGTVVFTVTHFSQYAVGYNKVSFDDVSAGDWYYDAVTFCAAREITTGTGDNKFSPDTTLTRGQFIVMLMRTYGIEPDENSIENFDDAGVAYYTGYLAAAKSLGITNGTGNNLFEPEAEITRQDMFTLLYRALDVLDELPEAAGAFSLSDFGDADTIADYDEKAMRTFVEAGIISGNGGKLDPLGNSTRAQMVQVLYNLLNGNCV